MFERTDTKQRILDAAEKLFSDGGLARTSLRAITGEAGVNVAAIHYHFGSRQALVRELLARRVAPINQARLRLLDAIERRTEAGALTVEAVLAAFVEPVVQVLGSPDIDRRNLAQLIGRFYAEPDEVLEPLLREQFGEVAARFLDALARALPDLSRQEVACRLHFAVGILAHVLLARHELNVIPELRDPAGSGADLGPRLVRFLAAGFRAPAGGPGA